MPQIAANGLTFDVEDIGEPGAPVVLLIMGLGMPAAAWPVGFVEHLVRAGLRVIRFDNRDSGHSPSCARRALPNLQFAIARTLMRMPVRAPYTLDDMAADADALLAALGVERAHVVGASMGGMIAQVLAARHPQRVRSLTSIMSSTGNPSPRIAFGSHRALRAILLRPRSVDDVAQLTDHLIRVFSVIGSPGFPPDPAMQREHLERVARRGYYPAGVGSTTARHSCVGRSPVAAGAHRSADTGDPWPRRSARTGGGRHGYGTQHPRCGAEGHSRHGA